MSVGRLRTADCGRWTADAVAAQPKVWTKTKPNQPERTRNLSRRKRRAGTNWFSQVARCDVTAACTVALERAKKESRLREYVSFCGSRGRRVCPYPRSSLFWSVWFGLRWQSAKAMSADEERLQRCRFNLQDAWHSLHVLLQQVVDVTCEEKRDSVKKIASHPLLERFRACDRTRCKYSEQQAVELAVCRAQCPMPATIRQRQKNTANVTAVAPVICTVDVRVLEGLGRRFIFVNGCEFPLATNIPALHASHWSARGADLWISGTA